ncbi:hypothetical protein [Desulfobacca acetoxidans]|uniref:Lipoprotein n=1 Tax=Desulfobacca acetoxidans (strain ATCC 700848 / DSM 11109 / ASRB2) TaxID=880072 RepID=F2NGY0_DESAR|nr:hypothetical protein [Desulfobacca acetoxidans]AEB08751.1 hypothetical protein Desac_0874 [Desulfobacca acetoxidans DSM 11109]
MSLFSRYGQKIILLAAVVGVLLAGCTGTPQGGRRLNLSPLLFYSEEPAVGRSRMELLGPIYSRQRDGGSTLTTVAPLFYIWRNGDGGTETEFLYPLGHYKTSGGDSRFSIIPFSAWTEELPEGASTWQFFPFYGGRTSGGEAYGGIFPLFGTYKERFHRDSGAFFLWPLYSTSTEGEARHYRFLWPLFSYSTGGEQACTFWPLGGKIIKPGVYEKYYALWPLIHYQRLQLDTENPRTVNMALPFYVWDTSPMGYRKSILFPFFTHYHQDKGNFEQWDAPWPLYQQGDGDNFYLRNYFPFYYRKIERSRDQMKLFWLLYDRITEDDGQRWERIHRYLIFSTYLAEIDGQGNWSEKHRLWPLFYDSERSDFRHFHAPVILPMQSEGWDRLFGPWLYLWTQDRQNEYRQGRLLWGIYRWEETPEYRLWELSFLASRQTTATGGVFRLLSGLLTLEREGTMRRLKLLYLPWGLHW